MQFKHLLSIQNPWKAGPWVPYYIKVVIAMIEFRWKSDKEKYEREKRALQAKTKREKELLEKKKRSRRKG